jgi:parallel beta-helix repeat protein
MRGISVCVLLLIPGIVSCSNDHQTSLLQVPDQFQSIQDAIDNAQAGDIVEVKPGVYNESLIIDKDRIVVRGTDRNSVILDGQYALANGIFVAANDIRIENLTVHSFTQNGIFFSGIDVAERENGSGKELLYGTNGASLTGFEVRWITAYNNGLYGIYAFASQDGLITDSLVSGHPDSGIYVGQCKPCKTIIRRVVAEFNAIGYYGTNASGDVYVIESTFRFNRLGVAPNSQRSEMLYPQEETYIVGNHVHDNDEPRAPKIMDGFFGGGIVVGGGSRNLIARNRVTGHDFVGIAVTDFNDFTPSNNEIRENTAGDNGFDLVISLRESSSGRSNCFAANVYDSSSPPRIQEAFPCGKSGSGAQLANIIPPESPTNVDYREIPAPHSQPTMPRGQFSRRAGVTSFIAPELDSIRLP